MEAEGTFVAINNRVSQSVPHLHVHIVPRRKKDGLRGFFWPRQAHPAEENMRQAQAAIRAALTRFLQNRDRKGVGAQTPFFERPWSFHAVQPKSQVMPRVLQVFGSCSCSEARRDATDQERTITSILPSLDYGATCWSSVTLSNLRDRM